MELLGQDHKKPIKFALTTTNPTVLLSSILAGAINGFIPVEDQPKYALF